jgi:hypothetical protein
VSTLSATIGRGTTGARPAASEAGRLYYDSTAQIWYRDNGSSWDSCTPSALTNPMTTEGDSIYGGAAGVPTRLAIGATRKVYKSNGTDPGWAFPSLIGTRVSKAAVQSINHGAATALNCDTEAFDTDAFHDTVANNTRITVPAGFDGYAQLGGSVHFAGNTTGMREAYIRKGGATEYGRVEANAIYNAGYVTGLQPTTGPIAVAAADYFELMAYQDSGAALNVTINSFWLRWLGV